MRKNAASGQVAAKAKRMREALSLRRAELEEAEPVSCESALRR